MTRRSIAAGGNENDLAAKGAAPSLVGPKGAGKTVETRTVKPSAAAVTKSKSTISTTTTAAATRKRAAFQDVTNASSKNNNNTGPSGAAGAGKASTSKPMIKPAVASSTTAVRRTIRTRSSTGGSGIHPETEEAEEEEHVNEHEDEEEEEDTAMALDDAPAPAPTSRPLKPLRKSAAVSVSAPKVPSIAITKPSGGAGARRALAPKRANANANAPSGSSSKIPTGRTGKVLAHAARLRREQAEVAAREAAEELAVARREEEAHKAKKARTSDVDYFVDAGAEVEEEEDVKISVVAKDEGWEDLDEGDEEDPLMVSSYVVEVYEYLRELELTTMPDADYMANQSEVTWKMRGMLIDWLVEIHTKFRLLPETIFLATNIIDRFLSTRVVSLVKFQLVGVTALFIAAKYEEVVCPSVSNFLFMTDGGYTDDEILKAERYVLNMLDFNLSYPNPINFLRRISKADGYDIQSRTMAKYLMEISIVDHKFLACPPSLIAAAGNWLARKILDKGAWDANLVHYSGYTEEELKPTAQLMLDYIVRSSALANPELKRGNPLHTKGRADEVEHPNFIKKYDAKKFFKASTSVRKWAEHEYAPIEYRNPKTGKVEREHVAAVL